MQCPKCPSEPLRASKLEQGLSAMGCNQCNGAFVTLLYYRDWLERTPAIESTVMDQKSMATALIEVNDSKSALCCPKCSRLMNKYKISGEAENRIDLCSSCDEVWLDGGEWELLKIFELSREMPLVFTEQWQRKLRNQATQKAREDRLAKVVSEQDLEEAIKIRKWLSDHPSKQQVLFFINQERGGTGR